MGMNQSESEINHSCLVSDGGKKKTCSYRPTSVPTHLNFFMTIGHYLNFLSTCGQKG
jgi:hypothetical protein